MRDGHRPVLLLPLLFFGFTVWLFVQSQTEVEALMARAKKQWREGNYAEAVELYKAVYRDYACSPYADEALWEIGTIYYVNFYDVPRAIFHFKQLVQEYPQSELRADGYGKLAEIHELELKDLPQAIGYWYKVLSLNQNAPGGEAILYRVASAYLSLNHFDQALAEFQRLAEYARDEHSGDQARVRIGTILQMQKEHEESVEYFRHVVDHTGCPECRVQAQLALIESYEFMDNLAGAIEVARSIRTDEYPEDMKQELLNHLYERWQLY